MEIIETILWIAIGVALAVPITQAFCMRGERRRKAFLKDIYEQGCLTAFERLAIEAKRREVEQSDREKQAEYALGVHLEEERMQEHDA
jgi:hypothetical protein